MARRFVTIWFRYLLTDWLSLRRKALAQTPFVIAAPDHGRLLIVAHNPLAAAQGIHNGMVVADARAIAPQLEVVHDKPGLSTKVLTRIAEWCIRYTPVVAIDPPDGIILDASGCAHLWGGEEAYLEEIINRFKKMGYHAQGAMAGTIGAAWGLTRFGNPSTIINPGAQSTAILPLPAAALRIETAIAERLHKLGLRRIGDFIAMPRSALRRRFGQSLVGRLHQALGLLEENIQPVQPVLAYRDWLPSPEPIVTRKGIEIALERLLATSSEALKQKQEGIRTAVFTCYRTDGKIEKISIGTNRATANTRHLFKLFEFKVDTIAPGPGIELFLLEAPQTGPVTSTGIPLWETDCGLQDTELAELLDRIEGKTGTGHVHRYLPAEHYWPERSYRPVISLDEADEKGWHTPRPRPLQLLARPEQVEVTAPIPDYPPMLFRYKGTLHKIIKADGPERIEQEWWLQQGEHRDYYAVEDENGFRYWLFRLGHYTGGRSNQWFIHGFFA